MELYTVACEACKSGLRSAESRGYELSRCKHGFCKPCLAVIVADCLVFPRSVQDYSLVTCPVEGCGRAFSRQDLRFVVGPGVLSLLDDYVMQLLTRNVMCPLLGRCTNCRATLLVSADKLQPLELESALHKNGLDKNTHGTACVDLEELLKDAIFCSKCFLMLCSNCGALLPSLAEAPHQCEPLQKKCFDFACSIMKLCSAYVQATQCYKTKKARKFRLFSFFRSSRSRGNMQRLSSKNTELGPSLADSELMLKSIMSGFHEDGTGGRRVEGTDSETCSAEAGNQVACVGFLRKKKRRAFDAWMDKHAQAALQDLTSSIQEMLQVDHEDLPPFIVALLCSHSLPYKLLKWLVRNDSVVHITEHSALYGNLLAFLRALSSSWDLLPLLCNPESKYDSWVVELRWEMPGSVMSDFQKLFKQAQFMLRRDEHLGEIELARPGITILLADIKTTYELLCNRIKVWEEKTSQHEWVADTPKAFARQILKCEEVRSVPDKEQQLLLDQLKSLIYREDSSVSASPSSSNTTTTNSIPTCDADQDSPSCKSDACSPGARPSAALVEEYKKALRPLQFDEGCLLRSHYFRKDVESRKSFTLNKRRALVISNEMTELNTVLPLEWESSIFVRMDEQHTDVLRALIIGPEGTPYENGVFLFDLLLGEQYPDMPPKVQFLTTNGGKVRFNPNLYANGKVCLSILGTWHGPGWKAGESSIMQVLISIQALVMVADPFYNEPMFNVLQSRKAADTYILNQRYHTLAYSLLPALRSPDPLFKPVIHAHFRVKAPYILRQWNAWIEEETRVKIKESLCLCLRDLRVELQKLTDVSLE